MRIAIKGTHITSGGGLTHLNKIIEWFARLAPDTQFVLIGKTGQDKLFISRPINFDYRYYKTPARNLIAQLWWERRKLPKILRKLSCDLLFEPGNYGTLSSSCPKVTLVHNLAPFDPGIIKQAGLYQKIRLTLLRSATIKSIKSSDGIIFLSKFAENMISTYIDLSDKHTTIIYHGIPEETQNLDDQRIIRQLKIPSEFILCVSHVYRYKNLLQLIEGYVEASKAGAGLPSLIVAGAKYDVKYMKRIEKAILHGGVDNRIKFLGSIDEISLGALYRNCKYFVFPSSLENCPNILLEALGHGCATLCSNTGVMPEICGDAALYFNPFDAMDIARKLKLVNSDYALRENLSERARNRAKCFGWQNTARGTLQFFDRVLGREQIEMNAGKQRELVKI